MNSDTIKKQMNYCNENDLPMFIPSSGICYSCGKDITQKIEDIVDKELITGCPYCNCSYCE